MTTWGIVILCLVMLVVSGLVLAASILSSRMNDNVPILSEQKEQEDANQDVDTVGDLGLADGD